MHITKFQVEGFRGFKNQLTLELDTKVNVLVGVNGAGKSSLLDGMDMLLYSFKQKINNNITSNHWSKNYVNDDKDNLQTIIYINSEIDELIFSAYQRKGGDLQLQEGNNIRKINSNLNKSLPILQYYKTSRSFSPQDFKSSNKVSAPYDETFEEDIALFSDFKNWFVNARNMQLMLLSLNWTGGMEIQIGNYQLCKK